MFPNLQAILNAQILRQWLRVQGAPNQAHEALVLFISVTNLFLFVCLICFLIHFYLSALTGSFLELCPCPTETLLDVSGRTVVWLNIEERGTQGYNPALVRDVPMKSSFIN